MIHDSGLQRFVYEGVGSVPLRESVSLVCGHLFVALSCSGLWVWPTVPLLHPAGRLDRRHQGRQKVSRKNSRRKTHALAKNQPHVFCFPCPQTLITDCTFTTITFTCLYFFPVVQKCRIFVTAPPGRKPKVISDFSLFFVHRLRSAQFEETLLVTETGCEVLTRHLLTEDHPVSQRASFFRLFPPFCIFSLHRLIFYFLRHVGFFFLTQRVDGKNYG